jgi:predicted amidohydrolase YtcJ
MKATAILALLFLPLAATAEPSLVLLHGTVFTGDPAKPWAEAVAIEGNKISAVGTSEQIARLAGPATRVIDVGNRVVIAGINDAHMHPGFATPVFAIDRGIDATWAQIGAAIASAAEESPADLWITATIGPGILLDPNIDSTTLDELAPGRRILLQEFSGHGMILSSAALEALGIAPDAPDPFGGWYGRDRAGRIDGHAHEYADFAAGRKLANMASDEELVADIRAMSVEAVRYGITSVQAMPALDERRFAAGLAQSDVPLRVRIMHFPMSNGDAKALPRGSAMKWILDGTPIEKGAALRKPYAGGGEGRLNFRDMAPLVKVAADGDHQLLVHAAGDRTISEALALFAKHPTLKRPRIEHGDGLQKDLIPLAKKTGAVVVQNPSHFPFRNTYPEGDYFLVRSLVKNGIPLALGSDGPLNPYLNIMLATHREDSREEALSREEAVIAYTRGSAYAEMKEKEKGTIAPGMLADLAALSQDIFKVPSSALPGTESVLTIIDGKVVHSTLE